MKTKLKVYGGLGMLLTAQSALAVPEYVGLIPNGNVYSCATCHTSVPARNPFGSAFASNGHLWNLTLARLDSDGDGFTNGTELGDPNGTGTPTPGAFVTNPGDPNDHPSVVLPAITTQPQSQTVTAGANVTFTVLASGMPLNYQWKKDGNNISGATTSALTLNAVTTASAGSYTVAVSNSAGSVTSNPAMLTVNQLVTAPTITTQPQSQTVTAGANVTFTVVATGTAPLSYQWRKDGNNITGATMSTLTLNAVTTASAGSYTVVVSNSAGSATSNPAMLTVNQVVTAPTITTQPQSQTVMAGASVTFTVVATGSAPLNYQWRKDGNNINGATTSSLTVNGVTSASGGSYMVVVSNSAGSATSNPAILTVNPVVTAPTITTQPQSQTVTAGANATFTVVATGTAPLSYQWRRDGNNITGATTATLTLNAVTTANAGSYTVVVSNSAGSATSNPAMLTVNPVVTAPTITAQPQSQTVTAGANVTFTVVATGTTPLSYQWKKDGNNIAGATRSSLSLNGVTTANAGSYTVLVSNSAGSATSNPAVLTVNPVVVPLSVTLTSPTNGATYVAPADVLLEAEVTSSQAVAKVELFVGTELLDTLTTAPYSAMLTNVPVGAYTFTAIVTDVGAHMATSAPVTITVTSAPPPSTNQPPVVLILTPRDGTTLYSPYRVDFTATASDPDGTIKSVEFFAGANRLGAGTPINVGRDDDEHDGSGDDDDLPQTLYVLSYRGLQAGTYSITAKATDNEGAVTTSAPVTLTIKSRSVRPTSRDD